MADINSRGEMASGKSLDHNKLKEVMAAGRIQWRLHVLERLAERDIAQADVFKVLSSGDRIEDYPEDTPFPSALFWDGRPISPFTWWRR